MLNILPGLERNRGKESNCRRARMHVDIIVFRLAVNGICVCLCE